MQRLFFALHYVHLAADFPNQSRWVDWSKYTDEGWYGDAAIRHFRLGHWYVPGDFNPAAALPVWPLVEALVFRFTGVSVIAARALSVSIFGATLVAAWFLIARNTHRGNSSLAAPSALLLLAVSPFCFVFTRLAIIEPMLVLVTLLALLAAASLHWPAKDVVGESAAGWRSAFAGVRGNLPASVALGILLPVMVLTKTTALFLMPAIFWMILARADFGISRFLRLAAPPALLGLALWLVYFLGLVRPHFLADFRYLFSANAYTGITRENFLAVVSGMLKDGRWMGPILYPCAMAAAIFALLQLRRLAASPLVASLLLWAGGYMAFLAYHNNLQPRYYLVIAVPLTLLLPVVVEDLLLARIAAPTLRWAAVAAAGLAGLAILVPDAVETLGYVRQPEYTLINAAHQVEAYIDGDRKKDPNHNPLILSISGSDISLMTHLPSICDDFGTMELVDRIRKYQPGWYVAWNQVEDDKLDAMSPQYQLERVAAFPAMDDPDRNLLVLYKLYPAGQLPPRLRRKPVLPRRLRPRVGQQPSPNQLEH